jgi:hypothetical protein
MQAPCNNTEASSCKGREYEPKILVRGSASAITKWAASTDQGYDRGLLALPLNMQCFLDCSAIIPNLRMRRRRAYAKWPSSLCYDDGFCYALSSS